MAAAIPSKVSKIVDVFVSVGAAIVIWGALQKILHAPNADFWLKAGLGTEAIVFLVYGALYAYYPAVKDASHDEEQFSVSGAKSMASFGAMDKMIAEADITPDTMKKLGEGFKQLNTTVTGLNGITDTVAATSEFATKTREVTGTLDKVKDAYTTAASSVGAFNTATEGAKQFHDQIQVLTKNLSSLNTIYELELQESNNHLKALNAFYGKLSETSASMLNSAEDAKKVQEQIGSLANNLGKLNGIYGNMITAMQGRN
ncbi:MAG: gliding motility protein GldL [Chitinophagaceae bacterium]|nr:gliding motility protein GldL [Chitinophagaceae bacterium]MBK8310002.1 gliding motility protein GldL [Chitinophagaceae bacterium]MBK8607194.1 gliding motility protein GldL [Chitinophagaceae bacterium]MBP6476870.1 gliding motility protein GldL [Chitinophagaceae bacterium]MBP7108158.1 gliding motility protein GldL [Chitinophagaceae bacterium]